MLQSRLDGAHPELLFIGHVTCDLVTADLHSACRLGGTVSFAAATAVKLDRRPTVLTRAAATTDLGELPDGVDLHVLPSPRTTTFANVYTDHSRVQYCYAQALPITAADVPDALRRPQAVLLGPLVNEITPDVAALFPDESLVAAVPQGWMRAWDETGLVHAKPWDSAGAILPHLDVLVLSLEDIAFDLSRLDLFVASVPLVVLTEYYEGSTIYRRQGDGQVRLTKIPPRPARELDPTGAGDIFATAFMIRLQETGDPVHAARFANVTASFGVEHLGIGGIPSREQVLAYMADHPIDTTAQA